MKDGSSFSPLLRKGLACLGPQRVYDLVPFFLLPSLIKITSMHQMPVASPLTL